MGESTASIASNWPILVSAILGSGVTTAVLSAVIASVAKGKDRKRKVDHLALKLAFQFERYAINANKQISDYQFQLDSHPHSGDPSMAYPTLGDLPESDEYEHLPKETFNKIQSFVDWTSWKQSESNFRHEAEGRFSGYAAARLSTAKLGVMALEIADDLRAIVGTGKRGLVFDGVNVRILLKNEAC